MADERYYMLMLHLTKGIVNSSKRLLLDQLGNAKQVVDFLMGVAQFVPAVQAATEAATRELNTVSKGLQQLTTVHDDDYPFRLRHCLDAPLVLFFQGNLHSLNVSATLAVIGTRKCTSYGKNSCHQIISGLSALAPDFTVVSGLAFGVDIVAHRSALHNRIPTVGVVAHGLEKIRPVAHQGTADQMLANGGAILSEYPFYYPASKRTFPERNRIVAGLSDATLVVESAEKGGSLITAYQAHSYNRDVLAVPGPTHFPASKGCNNLIKRQVAALVESATDIQEVMGWQTSPQLSLQLDLSGLTASDRKVVQLLTERQPCQPDQMARELQMATAQIQAGLLGLELNGWIRREGSLGYVLAR